MEYRYRLGTECLYVRGTSGVQVRSTDKDILMTDISR